jgi:hypothetical protein
MNGQREASVGAMRSARGWLPIASKVGNVLIVTLDGPTAWRLGEAFQLDPFAPPTIADIVETGLRKYLDEVVPE